MITASGGMTSIIFTVSENNVEQSTVINLTIAAVNLCGETGSVATVSYISTTLTSVTTVTTPTVCKYFIVHVYYLLLHEATKVFLVAIESNL